MKIQELIDEWNKDCIIDKAKLDDESLKIPLLHSKYYNYFIQEKLILQKLESEYKKLELEKYEFYTMGHTEETKQKGWKLPPKGMVLKSDVNMYIKADPDIIDLTTKISLVQEKINFLDSIIKSLQYRSYTIKNAIEFMKFTQGF
jgi:hypothetical protein